MTTTMFVCFLMPLFMAGTAQLNSQKFSFSLHQERRFLSAKVGDTVTLRCFYDSDDSAWLYWYKHSLDQAPRLVSTFYIYDTRITFTDEFNDRFRFRLSTANKTNHLTILNIQLSDSATYYCARSYSFTLNFTEGTVLSVKGSGLSIQPSVYQSESETIQNEGSVTLNCTVHTGSCGEEHSVYWFKTSEEAQQEIIYTHGGRNDHCERTHNREINTCVYNLPMKNMDLSHAGTYYCAVASCGLILFGNGTKLDQKNKGDSLVLVYILTGAQILATILLFSLAFFIYKENKRNRCAGSQPRVPAPSTEVTDADLHYAALSVRQPNQSRRQKNGTNSDCVYSSVKL